MSYRHLFLTVAATTLLLAACDQKPAGPATGAPIASLPLAESAPPLEVVAPAANQLPPAPPLARLARPPRPLYSYVDDAYELGDAFADSPPDYTVDYDGARPWVWRSGGGEYRVVEQTPYGIREYFYRGDSDYPFLIRDSDYAYAYDGGELVEVFDSYGRPYQNYGPSQIDYASRYLVRGRRLYNAAVHEPRQAAYAADWRTHRDVVLAPQRQWAAEQQHNEDWRRWREQRAAQPEPRQASFAQERAQRRVYAAGTAAAVIAAAPGLRPGGQTRPEARRDLAAERDQAAAVAHAQAETQRQRAQLAGREQHQQAQAESRARNAAEHQQRAQAETANRVARDQQRGRAEAQVVQRGQAEAHARSEAQRQEAAQTRQEAKRPADTGRQQAQVAAQAQHRQEAQVREQRAQAEAALRAQRDTGRRQAEQAQAATRASRDQQVQAQAANRAAREQQAQQRQAQAEAHAQAAQQAQHAQRAQQAAAQQAQQAQQAQHAQQAAAQQAQRAQQAQHAQQAAAQQPQHAQRAQAGERPHPGKDNDKGKPQS